MDGYCLLKKTVDKSLLVDGFTIPVAFQNVFFQQLGFKLAHGESRQITIMIDGTEYQVKLANIAFDSSKFDHPELLQVRYGSKSPIAIHFQQCFKQTANLIREHYEMRSGSERFKPSKDSAEYIAVYSTPLKGVLMVDCITHEEYQQQTAELGKMDELLLENAIDLEARIELKESTKKIRRLTKSIGDSLKLVYGYRCQICGQYIGEPYGSTVIHAHHIDYFVKSMNNNADNILIVCPNHHAIIHDRNPVFDRQTIQYKYPNGYSEGLRLNKHLKAI